jgi:hypothetical protein
MDLIEDIAGDLEPELASTQSPEARRARQGQRPRVRASLEALHAEGLLLPYLRPVARVKLVAAWLKQHGYTFKKLGRDVIEDEYRNWLQDRGKALPRPRQGHRPKIRAALDSLDAEGRLLPYLLPHERARLVTDRLMAMGYSGDMPGRHVIEREYRQRLREVPEGAKRSKTGHSLLASRP